MKLLSNSLFFCINVRKVVILFIVFLVTMVGDTVVHQYTFPILPVILKCVADNLTHFLIAFLMWMYVESLSLNVRAYLYRAVLCGSFASLIDIDHFIASGTTSFEVMFSFYRYIRPLSTQNILVQVAVSLSDRPSFHCTTLFLVLSIFIVFLSIQTLSKNLVNLAFTILIASCTHHWRDGYRRGIWLCPFLSTPSYSYLTYILGLMSFPLMISYVYDIVSFHVSKPKEYSAVVCSV